MRQVTISVVFQNDMMLKGFESEDEAKKYLAEQKATERLSNSSRPGYFHIRNLEVNMNGDQPDRRESHRVSPIDITAVIRQSER